MFSWGFKCKEIIEDTDCVYKREKREKIYSCSHLRKSVSVRSLTVVIYLQIASLQTHDDADW